MYPHLKVGINKEFDKVMCLKFINRKKAGIDFGSGIIKVHPQLSGIETKTVEDQKSQINQYFDDFYGQNTAEMEACRNRFVEDWDKEESKFFKLCDKYFD